MRIVQHAVVLNHYRPSQTVFPSVAWCCNCCCCCSGLPPPLVLVDDSTILCLQDRIKGLLLKMAAMQREAQYQVGPNHRSCWAALLSAHKGCTACHSTGAWLLTTGHTHLMSKRAACQPNVCKFESDRMCVSCLWQVMRQTQALKESLSFSGSQVSALTAEMQQLKAELEQCRQKAVTDQEQVRASHCSTRTISQNGHLHAASHTAVCASPTGVCCPAASCNTSHPVLPGTPRPHLQTAYTRVAAWQDAANG